MSSDELDPRLYGEPETTDEEPTAVEDETEAEPFHDDEVEWAHADPDFPDDVEDVKESILRDQNYTPSRDIFVDVDGKRALRGIPLSMPYIQEGLDFEVLISELRSDAEENDDKKLFAAIKELEDYIQLREQLTVASEAPFRTLRGTDKEWLQKLTDGSRTVGSRVTPYPTGKRRGNAYGLQSGLGLGAPVRVDLPLSCISLELSGFSPINELSIATRVIEEYQQRGLRTVGLSYRSIDHTMVSLIVDYILEHVTQCSLRSWTKGDTTALKELIVPDDIEVLIAMSRASAYPQGYPVVYQCPSAILGKCSYKPSRATLPDGTETDVNQRLKFDATVWYDRGRISPAHQEHLAAKYHTLTKEQILQQQATVSNKFKRSIGPYPTLSDDLDVTGVTLVMKLGTIKDLDAAAHIWETRLKTLSDEIMTRVTDPDPDTRAKRKRNIRSIGMSTIALLADLPYVESIILNKKDGDDSEIADPEDIQEALVMIGADIETSNKILEDIANWRADNTLALVAVDNWKCPDCGTPHRPTEDHPNGLVPYSALYTFFTLMGYRPRR